MTKVFILLMLLFFCAAELQVRPHSETLKKALGDTVVLTCEWDEEGPGVIEWLDNHATPVTSTNSSSNNFVEKESDHKIKLFLNKVQQEAAGTYICRRSGIDHSESKEIELLVTEKIKFVDTPKEQGFKEGSDALVSCRVTSSPKADVTWSFKNYKNIGKSRKMKKYKQTEDGLLIKNISTEDMGVYSCWAEMAEEATFEEEKILVDVFIGPSLKKGLEDVERLEGEELAISCQATGHPTPLFTFFKDEKVITSNGRIKMNNNSVLFAPLSWEDAGVWRCKGENKAGSIESKARIRVLVEPQITKFEGTKTVENQPTEISCVYRGSPTPEVTLEKMWHNMQQDERVSVVKINKNETRMIIKKTFISDGGLYACRARSILGAVEHNASLTVLYKPRILEVQPQEMHIWPGKQKNISIALQSMNVPQIKLTRHQKPISHGFEILTIDKEKIFIRVSGEKGVEGDVNISVSNHYGSSSHLVRLKLAKKPSAPREIKIRQTFSTGFLVLISPPADDGGERINGYVTNVIKNTNEVKIVSAGETVQPAYNTHIVTSGEEIEIRNLDPDTAYELQVRAQSEVGQSEFISTNASTLPPRKPFPVRVLVQETDVFWRALVTWPKIWSGGSAIKQLSLAYSPQETEVEWKTQNVSLEPPLRNTRFLLEGLEANTTYLVKAKAQNKFGWSEFGEITEFRTKEDNIREVHMIHASLHHGVIIIITIIFILVLFLIIDLCLYHYLACGLSHCMVKRLRRGKLSDKEKVLEEKEKAALKGSCVATDTPSSNVI